MRLTVILASIFTFILSFSSVQLLFGSPCLFGDCDDACVCEATDTPANVPQPPVCLNFTIVTPGVLKAGCCRNLEDPVCIEGGCQRISAVFTVKNACCGNDIMIVFSGAGPRSVNPGDTSGNLFWPTLVAGCDETNDDGEVKVVCYNATTGVTTDLWVYGTDLICKDCDLHAGG